MYPLCCIDIRNFLNQFYFFANDDFAHPNVIDETLKDVSIDEKQLKMIADDCRPSMNYSQIRSAIRLSSALHPSIWDRLCKYSST